MKKYVFVTCSVFGVGGGQQYVSNKTEYLRAKGYKVYTVSNSPFSIGGKIIYRGLDEAVNGIFTELQYLPEAYPKRKMRKIIQSVVEFIDPCDSDEIVLESNSLICAVWAEKIAERVKGKHIVFSVSEHNDIDKYFCEFLEFKFARGEFATIGIKTMKPLFAMSSIVNEENCPILKAFLGDNVSDYFDERLNEFEKKDHSICIIGRGDKPYVEYACLEVADFCAKYPDKTFSIGLISEFRDLNKAARIKAKFEVLKNVNVYYWGYFSSFPTALFKMFDLYIGGAGCASLPYRQNALTLAMDLYSDKPLGLMGYNGEKTIDAKIADADMQQCLKDALFDKQYLKKEFIKPVVLTGAEVFSHHDKLLETGSNTKQYYIKHNKFVGIKDKLKVRFPFLLKIKKAIGR